MVNIVCTSKPCDGLLYYSYGHASYLNANLVIITHPDFTNEDYLKAIDDKFIHCTNIIFNEFYPSVGDTTLIMGRSMLTIAYLNQDKYTDEQVFTSHLLFNDKLLSVYSDNHPTLYKEAIEFFKPKVTNLCDFDIYPNGEGKQFVKAINFDILKEPVNDIQFEYLFMGTNKAYYESIKKVIKDYPNHGILTYDQDYIDPSLNNIFVPVKNLLGIFDKYVYTKDTFDPAPQIPQECLYYGKEVIYVTNKDFVDGEEVYRRRGFVDIKKEIKIIL
jgi:hypothetical protein